MASSPLRFESRAARGRCLRRLFPKADPHGALLAHRRIDWTTDPASGRFPRPGGVGARERLCAAGTGRLCWAGSATECSPIAATVEAAYHSGMRAAAQVCALLEGERPLSSSSSA